MMSERLPQPGERVLVRWVDDWGCVCERWLCKRCGAVKHVNVNGRHTEAGPWRKPIEYRVSVLDTLIRWRGKSLRAARSDLAFASRVIGNARLSCCCADSQSEWLSP